MTGASQPKGDRQGAKPRGFRSLGFVLLFVTIVSTIVVVAIATSYAIYAWNRREDARPVPMLADIATDLLHAIQGTRLERGTANTALAFKEAADAQAVDEILAIRSRSNTALDSALAKLDKSPLEGTRLFLQDIGEKREQLNALRRAVDSAMRRPRDQRTPDLSGVWIETNGKLVDAIDRLSVQLDSRIGRANATIAKMVQLREGVWSARANSGDDRLFIAAAMARGERLTDQERNQLISLAAQVDGAWKIIQAQTYRPDTPQKLREAVETADSQYFGDLREKRQRIIDALSRGEPPPFSTREWLAMSRAGQDSMFQVGAMALTLARVNAEEQLDEAQWIFVGALLSIALFLALGVSMALYVSRFVIVPLRKITEATSAVAAGQLGQAIPFGERRDEIGSLSRALRVFRDSAMAKELLRSEKDKALSDLAIAHEQLEAKVEERTRDLKQEIAVNAQLQAKLRQAEKMEALGTLAGGVAHELNNLLQPVIMMTELTLSELPEQSPHHAQLQRVVDAGGKAAEIVQRILAFGRVDEACRELLDISSVVRDAVAFVRTILPTSITLHVDILDHAGTVRGDRTQLTQVVINLATNARDAIGANVGSVWISLSRLEAGTQGARPQAIVKIRDSGSGMDEATLRRIFEPFFTTKGVGKGTGLGLSVTHGIVTGHGGAIDVETARGRGTTFSISLPLDEADMALALTA